MYKKVQKGYIVYRKQGTREQHAHFNSKHSAMEFIKLMNKKLLPRSDYYKASAKRVLTEDEYNRLKTEVKQKYVNVNRGIKHA